MAAQLIKAVRCYVADYNDFDGPHAEPVNVHLAYWPDAQPAPCYTIITPWATLPGNIDSTETQMRHACHGYATEAEALAMAQAAHPHYNSKAARQLRQYIAHVAELNTWEEARYRAACKLGNYLLPVRTWASGAARIPADYRKAIASWS